VTESSKAAKQQSSKDGGVTAAGTVARPTAYIAQRELATLVGIPYERADCWQIVVSALARLNVKWPWEFEHALAAESALAEDRPMQPPRTPFVGDVIVMRFAYSPPSARDHVGLYIGMGQVLHTTRGGGGRSRLERMATLRRIGCVKRILAVRAFADGEGSPA
jgi:hypothetical protein